MNVDPESPRSNSPATDVPTDFDAPEISDEELTSFAMAADADMVLGDDAVPFEPFGATGLLPDWYMPAAHGNGRSRTRRAVLALVVVSLLALNAAGLCVTYGEVVVAW